MKKILFVFLILLGAIGLGFLIHQDPGYVMISYRQWIIATSIWVAVAMFIISFFILYFLVRLLKNIFELPEFFARRKQKRYAKKYQRNIAAGLINMALGDFSDAEKNFSKTIRYSATDDLSGYLLAAKAAHDEKCFEKRDDYLQKALLINPDARFAIELSQARFYLASDQWDDALFLLKKLYQQQPKNTLILSALKTIYLKLHDTQSLNAILPQLKKQKLISSAEMSANLTA